MLKPMTTTGLNTNARPVDRQDPVALRFCDNCRRGRYAGSRFGTCSECSRETCPDCCGTDPEIHDDCQGGE